MKYKLPVLYKKLLILAVVFGPIVWLMFTADGQRRTDTVVLWLFGEKEIKMDLNALDGSYTVDELQTVYTDLEWQCQQRETTYGDQLCVSRIGIFNGIPAKYITAFFQANRITALKLHYRDNNHDQFIEQLIYQLGQPVDEARASVGTPNPDDVLQWYTPYALVIIKRKLAAGEEPALFWLASR